MYDLLDGVDFDDDTVLAELFLNENDLFGPFDDEITTGVKGTLCHPGQLGLVSTGEDALVAAQHDRDTADVDIWSLDDLLSAGVLDGDVDRCAVCGISETTFVGSDGFVDGVWVCPVRETDGDVGVFEPEPGVDV